MFNGFKDPSNCYGNQHLYENCNQAFLPCDSTKQTASTPWDYAAPQSYNSMAPFYGDQTLNHHHHHSRLGSALLHGGGPPLPPTAPHGTHERKGGGGSGGGGGGGGGVSVSGVGASDANTMLLQHYNNGAAGHASVVRPTAVINCQSRRSGACCGNHPGRVAAPATPSWGAAGAPPPQHVPEAPAVQRYLNDAGAPPQPFLHDEAARFRPPPEFVSLSKLSRYARDIPDAAADPKTALKSLEACALRPPATGGGCPAVGGASGGGATPKRDVATSRGSCRLYDGAPPSLTELASAPASADVMDVQGDSSTLLCYSGATCGPAPGPPPHAQWPPPPPPPARPQSDATAAAAAWLHPAAGTWGDPAWAERNGGYAEYPRYHHTGPPSYHHQSTQHHQQQAQHRKVTHHEAAAAAAAAAARMRSAGAAAVRRQPDAYVSFTSGVGHGAPKGMEPFTTGIAQPPTRFSPHMTYTQSKISRTANEALLGAVQATQHYESSFPYGATYPGERLAPPSGSAPAAVYAAGAINMTRKNGVPSMQHPGQAHPRVSEVIRFGANGLETYPGGGGSNLYGGGGNYAGASGAQPGCGRLSDEQVYAPPPMQQMLDFSCASTAQPQRHTQNHGLQAISRPGPILQPPSQHTAASVPQRNDGCMYTRTVPQIQEPHPYSNAPASSTPATAQPPPERKNKPRSRVLDVRHFLATWDEESEDLAPTPAPPPVYDVEDSTPVAPSTPAPPTPTSATPAPATPAPATPAPTTPAPATPAPALITVADDLPVSETCGQAPSMPDLSPATSPQQQQQPTSLPEVQEVTDDLLNELMAVARPRSPSTVIVQATEAVSSTALAPPFPPAFLAAPGSTPTRATSAPPQPPMAAAHSPAAARAASAPFVTTFPPEDDYFRLRDLTGLVSSDSESEPETERSAGVSVIQRSGLKKATSPPHADTSLLGLTSLDSNTMELDRVEERNKDNCSDGLSSLPSSSPSVPTPSLPPYGNVSNNLPDVVPCPPEGIALTAADEKECVPFPNITPIEKKTLPENGLLERLLPEILAPEMSEMADEEANSAPKSQPCPGNMEESNSSPRELKTLSRVVDQNDNYSPNFPPADTKVTSYQSSEEMKTESTVESEGANLSPVSLPLLKSPPNGPPEGKDSTVSRPSLEKNESDLSSSLAEVPDITAQSGGIDNLTLRSSPRTPPSVPHSPLLPTSPTTSLPRLSPLPQEVIKCKDNYTYSTTCELRPQIVAEDLSASASSVIETNCENMIDNSVSDLCEKNGGKGVIPFENCDSDTTPAYNSPEETLGTPAKVIWGNNICDVKEETVIKNDKCVGKREMSMCEREIVPSEEKLLDLENEKVLIGANEITRKNSTELVTGKDLQNNLQSLSSLELDQNKSDLDSSKLQISQPLGDTFLDDRKIIRNVVEDAYMDWSEERSNLVEYKDNSISSDNMVLINEDMCKLPETSDSILAPSNSSNEVLESPVSDSNSDIFVSEREKADSSLSVIKEDRFADPSKKDETLGNDTHREKNLSYRTQMFVESCMVKRNAETLRMDPNSEVSTNVDKTSSFELNNKYSKLQFHKIKAKVKDNSEDLKGEIEKNDFHIKDPNIEDPNNISVRERTNEDNNCKDEYSEIQSASKGDHEIQVNIQNDQVNESGNNKISETFSVAKCGDANQHQTRFPKIEKQATINVAHDVSLECCEESVVEEAKIPEEGCMEKVAESHPTLLSNCINSLSSKIVSPLEELPLLPPTLDEEMPDLEVGANTVPQPPPVMPILQSMANVASPPAISPAVALKHAKELPAGAVPTSCEDFRTAIDHLTAANVSALPERSLTGLENSLRCVKNVSKYVKNSSVRSEDPSIRSEDPSILSEDPSIRSEDPSIRSEDPSIRSEDPSIRSEDPSIRSEDPSILSEDPSKLTEDPSKLTEEPSLRSEDSSFRSENPSLRSENPSLRSENQQDCVESLAIVAEDLPIRDEDLPVRAEDPPVRAEDPPVRAEDPPVRAEDPPVRAEDPRISCKDLQVCVEYPSTHVEDSPTQVDDFPTRAEDSTALAKNSPAHVATHVEDTTARVEKPTTAEDSPTAANDSTPPAEDSPIPFEDPPTPATDSPIRAEDLPIPEDDLPILAEASSTPAEGSPKPSEELLNTSEDSPKHTEESPKHAEDSPKPAPKPADDSQKYADDLLKPAEDLPKPTEGTPKPADDASTLAGYSPPIDLPNSTKESIIPPKDRQTDDTTSTPPPPLQPLSPYAENSPSSSSPLHSHMSPFTPRSPMYAPSPANARFLERMRCPSPPESPYPPPLSPFASRSCAFKNPSAPSSPLDLRYSSTPRSPPLSKSPVFSRSPPISRSFALEPVRIPVRSDVFRPTLVELLPQCKTAFDEKSPFISKTEVADFSSTVHSHSLSPIEPSSPPTPFSPQSFHDLQSIDSPSPSVSSPKKESNVENDSIIRSTIGSPNLLDDSKSSAAPASSPTASSPPSPALLSTDSSLHSSEPQSVAVSLPTGTSSLCTKLSDSATVSSENCSTSVKSSLISPSQSSPLSLLPSQHISDLPDSIPSETFPPTSLTCRSPLQSHQGTTISAKSPRLISEPGSPALKNASSDSRSGALIPYITTPLHLPSLCHQKSSNSSPHVEDCRYNSDKIPQTIDIITSDDIAPVEQKINSHCESQSPPSIRIASPTDSQLSSSTELKPVISSQAIGVPTSVLVLARSQTLSHPPPIIDPKCSPAPEEKSSETAVCGFCHREDTRTTEELTVTKEASAEIQEVCVVASAAEGEAEGPAFTLVGAPEDVAVAACALLEMEDTTIFEHATAEAEGAVREPEDSEETKEQEKGEEVVNSPTTAPSTETVEAPLHLINGRVPVVSDVSQTEVCVQPEPWGSSFGPIPFLSGGRSPASVEMQPVDTVANWPYPEEEVVCSEILASEDGTANVAVAAEGSATESFSPEAPPPPRASSACSRSSGSGSDGSLKCRLSWKKIFALREGRGRGGPRRRGRPRTRSRGRRVFRGPCPRSPPPPAPYSASPPSSTSASLATSAPGGGLELGPAKIELRVGSRQATEESQSWQVVEATTPDAAGSSAGAAAEGASPEGTVPIVLVRRLVLRCGRSEGPDDGPDASHTDLASCPDSPSSSSSSSSDSEDDGGGNGGEGARGDGGSTTTSVTPMPSSSEDEDEHLRRREGSVKKAMGVEGSVKKATLAAATSSPQVATPTTTPVTTPITTPITTPGSSWMSPASMSPSGEAAPPRTPRLIIRRSGGAEYRSFLRGEEARWQPVVVLPRSIVLDQVARKLAARPLSIRLRFASADPIPTKKPPPPTPPPQPPPQPPPLDRTDGAAPVPVAPAPPLDHAPSAVPTAPTDSNADASIPAPLTTPPPGNGPPALPAAKDGDPSEHAKEQPSLPPPVPPPPTRHKSHPNAKDSSKREAGSVISRRLKKARRRSTDPSETSRARKRAAECGSSYAAGPVAAEGAAEAAATAAGAVPAKRRCSDPVPPPASRSPVAASAAAAGAGGAEICAACGHDFADVPDRATHVRQHRYHCQRCDLAFRSQEEFVTHLGARHPSTRERHHCLLCTRSFSTAERHALHVRGRLHRALEGVQRRTVHALFSLLTGRACPGIEPLSPGERAALRWLPAEPGSVHFYHQATPLQMAMQDWTRRQQTEVASAPPVPLGETEAL